MNDSQQTSRSFLHIKPPLSTKGGKNKFFFANKNGDSNKNQNENKENTLKQEFFRQNVNLSMTISDSNKRHIRQVSANAASELNKTTNFNNTLNSTTLNTTLNNTLLGSCSSRLIKKQSQSQLEIIEQLKQKKNTEYIYNKMGLNLQNAQEKFQKMMQYKPITNQKPIFFLQDGVDFQCSEQYFNYQDSSEENSFSSKCYSINKLNQAKYDIRDDNDEDDGKHLSLNFSLSDAKSQFLILSQNKKQQQIIQEQISQKQTLFAIKIQKNVRRYMQQKKFKKLKDNIIFIQYQLRKKNKIKGKRIKDHLFSFSVQQKKVMKELEKLIQIEDSLKYTYKNNIKVQKYMQKDQQNLFEQLNNYTKNNIKQKVSSYAQTNIQDIHSIKKEEHNKILLSTLNNLHISKTQTLLTPFNSSRIEGYLTTQDSLNYTERLHESCRCSSQKVIQKLRDELKQKAEYDCLKETNAFKELLFIQDEFHKSNIKHKSLMLQISEALKKFEIKIINDLSTSNQENFELIKDLQQINSYIQDQIMFCSPQSVKRRQFYYGQSSNDSSSAVSSKNMQFHKPVESRKLVFDSAGSFCNN